MTRRLTDLSQLTKSMVKKPIELPRPASKQKSANPPVDHETAEVLAYFARPAGNVPQSPPCNPEKEMSGAIDAALAEKDAALNALAEKKSMADRRVAELERRLAAEREAHEAAARERDRLQGECGRLQGELRKTADKGAVAPLIATPSGAAFGWRIFSGAIRARCPSRADEAHTGASGDERRDSRGIPRGSPRTGAGGSCRRAGGGAAIGA